MSLILQRSVTVSLKQATSERKENIKNFTPFATSGLSNRTKTPPPPFLPSLPPSKKILFPHSTTEQLQSHKASTSPRLHPPPPPLSPPNSSLHTTASTSSPTTVVQFRETAWTWRVSQTPAKLGNWAFYASVSVYFFFCSFVRWKLQSPR